MEVEVAHGPVWRRRGSGVRPRRWCAATAATAHSCRRRRAAVAVAVAAAVAAVVAAAEAWAGRGVGAAQEAVAAGAGAGAGTAENRHTMGKPSRAAAVDMAQSTESTVVTVIR